MSEEQKIERKLSRSSSKQDEFMGFFDNNPYLKHVSKSFRKTVKDEGKIKQNLEALEQTLKTASDYFDLDNILKKKDSLKENSHKKDAYEEMDAHFTKEYINLGEAALAEELYKRMIAQEKPDISEREKELRKQLTSLQAKLMIMDNDFKDLKQKNMELLSHNKMLSKRVENLLEEVDELTKAKLEYDRKLKNIEKHYKMNDETYKLIKGFIEYNMDDIEERALQKAKKQLKNENSKINLNPVTIPEKPAVESTPKRRSSLSGGLKPPLLVGPQAAKETNENKEVNANQIGGTKNPGNTNSPKGMGSPAMNKNGENTNETKTANPNTKKEKEVDFEKNTKNNVKKKGAGLKK